MYWDLKDARADLQTVAALARLQLAAHRRGSRVRFHGATAELRELIEFLGLGDVLPVEAPPGRSERR